MRYVQSAKKRQVMLQEIGVAAQKVGDVGLGDILLGHDLPFRLAHISIWPS
jgi:hypothetical protein